MNKFIQFGKFGDIMNVMPALNEGGSMVVDPAYATILDGVKYIEPILGSWDLDRARRDHPDGRVTLVQELRRSSRHAWDAWELTGLSQMEWSNRPLIFDNRNVTRESKQFGAWNVKGKVLYNLSSETFKLRKVGEIREKIRKDYIDISYVRAERIYDMLYLFERAKALITVDTSLLHLARVTGIPTIAIGPDDTYLFTPPRPHWLWACSGKDAAGWVERMNSL